MILTTRDTASVTPTEVSSGSYLLGGAQPVIPPNLVYEHNSLGSPGKVILTIIIHKMIHIDAVIRSFTN